MSVGTPIGAKGTMNAAARLVFHDHEGFSTLYGSKSFAIMKLRARIRN
jgi:hypothetical protein